MRASLSFFFFTTAVAIGLSFISGDALCLSLASHHVALTSSSVYGLVISAIHRRVCASSLVQDGPGKHHRQDDWNLFHHLGGNGPWIQKLDPLFGTYEAEGKPPEGCVVDQVHMVSETPVLG